MVRLYRWTQIQIELLQGVRVMYYYSRWTQNHFYNCCEVWWNYIKTKRPKNTDFIVCDVWVEIWISSEIYHKLSSFVLSFLLIFLTIFFFEGEENYFLLRNMDFLVSNIFNSPVTKNPPGFFLPWFFPSLWFSNSPCTPNFSIPLPPGFFLSPSNWIFDLASKFEGF